MNEEKNIYAEKLLKGFSRFKRIHWRPPHIDELKPSEFMVLSTVKHTYIDMGYGMRISEISDRLNVAVPTVTQLVKSLENKGYVEKEPDKDDKRVIRVTLSAKGRESARKGYEEFYKRFAGLAEYLGDEKSEELVSLLHEVFEYFSSLKPE